MVVLGRRHDILPFCRLISAVSSDFGNTNDIRRHVGDICNYDWRPNTCSINWWASWLKVGQMRPS